MPADEILPPVTYSWWPFAVGLALIILVIVGWIVLFRLTRRPKVDRADAPLEPRPQPSEGDVLDAARSEALAQVAGIEDEFRSGAISERDVHQQLASVIREFTLRRTGIPAASMTLTDLRLHAAAAPATALISQLYGPEFCAEERLEASAALQRTREVIGTW